MKANATLPSLGALALVTLLAASPAQACMPFFTGGVGQTSCATAQPAPQSCPLPGQGGNPGQVCGLINPELVAALGDMAAGGMQIATRMMQVLAREVGQYAAVAEAAR